MCFRWKSSAAAAGNVAGVFAYAGLRDWLGKLDSLHWRLIVSDVLSVGCSSHGSGHCERSDSMRCVVAGSAGSGN